MAGRAAMLWAGLAVVLGTAMGAWAIDPPPMGVRPGIPVPPPVPPNLATEPVMTSYRQPPEPPAAPINPAQPETRFREPPISPFLPGKPLDAEVTVPEGTRVNLPAGSNQMIRFGPRYGQLPNAQIDPIDADTNRLVYSGGVIVNVIYTQSPGGKPQEVEFAADHVVAWVKGKGAKPQDLNREVQTSTEGPNKTEVEMYLAGNVIIRMMSIDATGNRAVQQVLRANEIYYDVSRNKAIALCADLEMKTPDLPDSVHMQGREIWQLGPNEFKAFESSIFSSKRPAQPGLRMNSRESTLTNREAVRTNVFGVPYRNFKGETEVGYERILTNRGVTIRAFDTPFMYYPRITTDVNEPMGPLVGAGFGQDRVFGFQIYSTWNLYKILALRPPQGHSWYLYGDYLSLRGPALGSTYNYAGPNLFGIGQAMTGMFRAYGIIDHGQDVLGGDRGPEPPQPVNRGRFQWRHNQDLYEDGITFLRVLAQAEYFTDKNYFEQYFKQEFDFGQNQETFIYLYGASGIYGGSFLTEANWHRMWMTETEWLPKLDGYMLGKTFLDDRLVYSAKASGGYAELLPSTQPAYPVLATDQRVNTARFDVTQRLSAPFDLGAVRLDPYGLMSLTYYSQDLNGDSQGRFYGGGGLKTSVLLSRLYSDANSELFNVKGLYHKVSLRANYFAAYSNVPYNILPQLDRVSDDSTDFMYRTTIPQQPSLYPGPTGVALSTSPIFDPQLYAIRRLVENRLDTLDSIQVLQLEARQRWQTKRGFPGSEHVIDWLTFDASMSVFPDKNRDNFGYSTAFFEYFTQWYVGDRTSFSSAGWYDPFDYGALYFNVGANFARPDGTVFYVGYRHTDPIDSRALAATISYKLSRKYFVNLNAAYDFGSNKALSNQVSFTRVGTDVTMLFGVSYNALINNFGVQFSLVPNAAGVTNSQSMMNGTGFGGNRR